MKIWREIVMKEKTNVSSNITECDTAIKCRERILNVHLYAESVTTVQYAAR